MKEKKRKLLKGLSSLGVVLFGLLLTQEHVVAKEAHVQEQLITEVNLKKADGTHLTEPLKQWEKIKLEVAFQLEAGEVYGGEETTLQLPEELRLITLDRFEIKDNENRLIAIAQVLDGHDAIRIRFQNSVDKIKSSQGAFFLYARVDHGVVTEPTSIPISLSIDEQKYWVGELDYAGLNQRVETHITKSGWQKDLAPDRGQFELSLNRTGQRMTNTVVTEFSDPKLFAFDQSSFQVYKGRWDWQNGEWYLLDAEEITAEVELNLNDYQYVIELGDLEPDVGIQIRYETVAPAPLTDGDRLENPVILTWDDQKVSKVMGGYTYRQIGSLSALGIYGIEVALYSDNENPVVGAEIHLVDVETGEVESQGTTDENGKIAFSGLYKKDYRLHQTKAPDGYETMKDITVISENFTEEDSIVSLAFSTPMSSDVRQSLPVRIIWEDANNAAGARPNEVQTLLVQNGVERDQLLTIKESDNWQGEFKDLLIKGPDANYFYSAIAFGLPKGYYAKTSVGDEGVTITIIYRY